MHDEATPHYEDMINFSFKLFNLVLLLLDIKDLLLIVLREKKDVEI